MENVLWWMAFSLDIVRSTKSMEKHGQQAAVTVMTSDQYLCWREMYAAHQYKFGGAEKPLRNVRESGRERGKPIEFSIISKWMNVT